METRGNPIIHFSNISQSTNMDAIEIKASLEAIKEAVKTEGQKAKQDFEAAIADKAKSSDVEAIKNNFHEYTETVKAQFDKLQEAAEKQGLVIAGLTEKGAANARPQSFREAALESVKANAEKLAAMKDNKFAPSVNTVSKAAGTMLTTNILPAISTAVPYMLAEGSNEIIGIARRRPYLRQILNAKPINTMYATWAEQVNVDGAAAVTAEGAAKSQVDFDVQEATRKVEKVTAYAKATKELLADVQGMSNFIEEEIQELVELKFDDQLYNGSGTTPNLKGIVTWATTMSVASSGFQTAGVGVNFANNYDIVIAAQAIMANTYKFTPNVMLVNPLDYGLMQVEKSTQGVYLIPPFAQSMSMNIAGITVVANPGVTAGDFVIMDTSKLRLRIREEFNIDYGFENDDFTKNLVTVLGELRAVLYLPTNYAGAVLKGTFATVKAAMETA